MTASWCAGLAVALVVAPACTSDADTASIRIAAVYNTTGGTKWIEQPGLNGSLLAADRLNRSGGVLGRDLEVVVVEGNSDLTNLRQSLAEAVEQDVVAVVGVNDLLFALPTRGVVRRADGGFVSYDHSEPVLALGPVAADAGLPLVSASSTLPGLADRAGATTFTIAASSEAHVRALVRFARDRLDVGSVALLVNDSFDYATGIADDFERAWSADGGTIAVRVGFSAERSDLAGQVDALQGLVTPPDAILLAALPNEAGVIVEQLRRAGFGQPVLGADWFDTPYLEAFAGALADGVYFTAHGASDDPSPRVRRFADDYRARFGEAPPTTFAMLGYDAVGLVADAIERSGSTDPGAIADALEATAGYPALSGRLTYSDGSHEPTKPIPVLHARRGDLGLEAWIPPP